MGRAVEVRSQYLRGREVAVGDQHPGPLLDETPDGRFANAAGAAGDDAGLAFESHGNTPQWMGSMGLAGKI